MLPTYTFFLFADPSFVNNSDKSTQIVFPVFISDDTINI